MSPVANRQQRAVLAFTLLLALAVAAAAVSIAFGGVTTPMHAPTAMGGDAVPAFADAAPEDALHFS